MRFFWKKTSTKEKIVRFLEAIIVASSIIIFWRGVWNLMDMYFDSHSLFWNLATIFASLLVLLFTGKLLEHLFGEVKDDVHL